ncbi:hypothetical protein GCM10011326_45260 [Salipiger profundus]|uniref:Uncharacterized protein n=1 Tax=Salipiger profundus TaxID=1229727 RepID=A0A1U7D6C0_9RHOB|nr:hypothetical protein Ga0080559_TMP2814 [Salipiger profundus]GGA28121.1 hypothetical protein GCM10011326_45260 [Salipiger profundus]SFC76694.1 hypothetical protein SAMN05444415_1057 [Salipiger profundus]
MKDGDDRLSLDHDTAEARLIGRFGQDAHVDATFSHGFYDTAPAAHFDLHVDTREAGPEGADQGHARKGLTQTYPQLTMFHRVVLSQDACDLVGCILDFTGRAINLLTQRAGHHVVPASSEKRGTERALEVANLLADRRL